MTTRISALCAGIALTLASTTLLAQEKVLNLYSSRHYQTDEALYTGFTKLTGIKVNRIEAGEDPLIERLRSEGERSPADVLITVDAGRLWRAEQLGLFQPVKSQLLESRIPESYREPGGRWFGFSLRTRLIAYNKAKVRDGEIQSYEELADPKWKGRVCMRSSTNVYNLSLMGALIDHLGEPKAEAWAKGVRANLAQEPKGGDTDQLKSVAAGLCDVSASGTLGQAGREAGGGAPRYRAAEPENLGRPREHLGRRRAEERAAPRSGDQVSRVSRER
jgi:iron(III) transport system substrate-binding protein